MVYDVGYRLNGQRYLSENFLSIVDAKLFAAKLQFCSYNMGWDLTDIKIIKRGN